MLEHVELRDAWLGTLLPIAVAALLLLLLLVSRQRRRGSTSLDTLFRSRRLPDIRGLWRQAIEASVRARAERRERDRQYAMEAAALKAAERQAAEKERLNPKLPARIMSADGRTPILEVNQFIRVTTRGSDRVGVLTDITDIGLTLPDWTLRGSPEIRWDEVRQVRVRLGRERQLWIPIVLGILGAAALGFIGGVLDAVGASTSGTSSSQATMWGLSVGGAIGGFLGALIMSALPQPRWRKIAEVGMGSAPLTRDTFIAAAAKTAAETTRPEDQWEIADTVETIARMILMLVGGLILGIVAG